MIVFHLIPFSEGLQTRLITIIIAIVDRLKKALQGEGILVACASAILVRLNKALPEQGVA